MADEQEDGVGRRLLEHLEQARWRPTVRARRSISITATRQSDNAGRQVEELAKLAHLIDGDVAGEVARSSSFSSRSSQRMSGWLPASTSLTIGCSSAVSIPGRVGRRTGRSRRARGGPRHARNSPCRRPWARRAARHGGACARPGARELLDRACPARRSRQQVRDGVEQALRSLPRACPTRRPAARARALPRRSSERRARPCGDNRRRGPPMRSLPSASRARAALRLHPAPEPGSGPGTRFADSEGVDRAHRFDPEPARAALIGERTVDEAVGEHPFARLRAPDGSSCRHDLRAPRRTARPPPVHPSEFHRRLAATPGLLSAPSLPPGSRVSTHVDPAAAQGVRERLDLGRLADPLPAFERDEVLARRLTPSRATA